MTALPRYRRQLASTGRGSRRKLPTRTEAKRYIVARARGRCEWCGEWADGELEQHHAFRRGSIAGFHGSWAEVPELSLAVHERCHRELEDDPEKLAEARWRCLIWFERRYLAGTEVQGFRVADPIDTLRIMIRELEEAAING